MAFTTQPNFIGVLDGVNVNELNKKIDYTKTKLDERKQIVEKILDETNFYEEYFSNHFKADINAGDYLSTEINVCQSLEKMANYLLNSKEIKEEEDNEKTKYIFHTDEKYFKKKVDREQSVDQIAKTENSDHSETVIHFLKRDEGNFKKEKAQTILTSDIKPGKINSKEEIEQVIEVINEYKQFYDRITKKLVNKEKDYNRYILTKVKGQLTDDIIYTKDHLLGIFGYNLKNGVKETTQPSLDIFDFTNWNHIYGKEITFVSSNPNKKDKEHTVIAKGLMFFKPTDDFQDDFNITLIDLQNTIKKANLTEEEKQILDLAQRGLTLEEIAREFKTYHMKISRTLKRIANKIISVGDKYDLADKQ